MNGDGVDLLNYVVSREVLLNEDRRPILYDAKGRPLVRQVGFRPGLGGDPPRSGGAEANPPGRAGGRASRRA